MTRLTSMVERRVADDDEAERALLARIADGDRLAFEQFYGRYARRVLAFVRDIVSAPEIAEEVASDTLIAVWKAADRYAGRSRVITWVLGIAHHKALDALRRAGARPICVVAADRAGGPAGEQTPFERVDERLDFAAAVRHLSVEHRTVLQLMFGFDCSQAEIAGIVGCPIATVKTRVFYAKQRLRAHLRRATAIEEPA